MIVAVTALVIAMSGTAVAGTGGDLILGRTNKAASVTSLSNRKGTALALSSADGKPPLTVSNSYRPVLTGRALAHSATSSKTTRTPTRRSCVACCR
jgi:hypothetical protein